MTMDSKCCGSASMSWWYIYSPHLIELSLHLWQLPVKSIRTFIDGRVVSFAEKSVGWPQRLKMCLLIGGINYTSSALNQVELHRGLDNKYVLRCLVELRKWCILSSQLTTEWALEIVLICRDRRLIGHDGSNHITTLSFSKAFYFVALNLMEQRSCCP